MCVVCCADMCVSDRHVFLFFLMRRRPPRSTRTDTLSPYTTLFRSPRRWGSGAQVFVIAAYRESGPAARAPSLSGYDGKDRRRSEEHTSELQSLMRISYAVFCLKKKNTKRKSARQ